MTDKTQQQRQTRINATDDIIVQVIGSDIVITNLFTCQTVAISFLDIPGTVEAINKLYKEEAHYGND